MGLWSTGVDWTPRSCGSPQVDPAYGGAAGDFAFMENPASLPVMLVSTTLATSMSQAPRVCRCCDKAPLPGVASTVPHHTGLRHMGGTHARKRSTWDTAFSVPQSTGLRHMG